MSNKRTVKETIDLFKNYAYTLKERRKGAAIKKPLRIGEGKRKLID